ncbi:MAG: FHA domain-containing protein [Chloroflexi bacterium]|nr:FHA domain-containing protein [Chloroflexota bacterium]
MLGAIGAWGIMEPTSLMPDHGEPVGYAAIFVIGLISGLLIGLLLGLAEGMSGLSTRDAVKSAVTGALVGAAGGVVGLTLGNNFYNLMLGLGGGEPSGQSMPANLPPGVSMSGGPSFVSFLLLLIGRGCGWALIGGCIGLSQGIAMGSTKKMINGAVGGFLGGGIGGSVFEILAWMNRGHVANFLPWMIRMISFGITGAAIGLFIGFIEEGAKQAWLVRLVGRNEGKQHELYKTVTVLGRSEFVDIPIFSDPDVADRHAVISAHGKVHTIEDLGSFYGTTINNNKITKETLRDGDVIAIGKTKFLFRDKATAKDWSSARAAYDTGVRIPDSQHICPFCGAIKDAAGNCDCTVGAAPSAPHPIANNATVQQIVQQPAAQPTQDPYAQPQPGAQLLGHPESGAQLTAISGSCAGQVFLLKPGETHIGRDDSKDIGLSMDSTVSRNHARIAQEVTCFVLYDLGSTNGSYVNGVKVGRKELTNGDVVQIGNSKFRFDA